jgi:hypothetical protein
MFGFYFEQENHDQEFMTHCSEQAKGTATQRLAYCVLPHT